MRPRHALALLGLVAAAAAAAPVVLAQSYGKNVSPGKEVPPAVTAPAQAAPARPATRGAAPAAPAQASAPAAVPQGTPITAEHMAAHRAAYRLTLERARDNTQIAAANGAMLYEVLDACEGWTTRQRFTLTITDRDGGRPGSPPAARRSTVARHPEDGQGRHAPRGRPGPPHTAGRPSTPRNAVDVSGAIYL